jgi:hypothetical protein
LNAQRNARDKSHATNAFLDEDVQRGSTKIRRLLICSMDAKNLLHAERLRSELRTLAHDLY